MILTSHRLLIVRIIEQARRACVHARIHPSGLEVGRESGLSPVVEH
jgi:hypothetical protein